MRGIIGNKWLLIERKAAYAKRVTAMGIKDNNNSV